MYVSAVFDDAIERDGEMLVLVGNDITLLSTMGAVLVEACEQPKDLAALEAEAVKQLGVPEGVDSGPIVRSAVDDLLSRGILLHR